MLKQRVACVELAKHGGINKAIPAFRTSTQATLSLVIATVIFALSFFKGASVQCIKAYVKTTVACVELAKHGGINKTIPAFRTSTQATTKPCYCNRYLCA